MVLFVFQVLVLHLLYSYARRLLEGKYMATSEFLYIRIVY